MAWNEPGGSGNKDPWGGRGGNQSPPDLDEVVKKLQDKFNAVFGGKRGGASGRTVGGKGGGFGVGLIVLVLAAVWLFSGIYIVEEGTRGVVMHFGKYSKETMPGPHWYPRGIQTVEIVDIENIRSTSIGFVAVAGTRTGESNVTSESQMLTKDENIVDVKLAVQYKVRSASDFLFRIIEPELTLRQVTESVIREIIGQSNMDYILSEGRTEITALAFEKIQAVLDQYQTGLQLTTVNLQDAQAPEQVQEAFADAVKAQGDQQRVINEAKAYSNDVIPKARGNAARLVAEANAYKEKVIAEATGEASRFEQVLKEYRKAPEVTRKRLYIESMESMMSNSSKVLVDVKGGNNMLYLPLDRLLERSGATSGSSIKSLTDDLSFVPAPADSSVRDSARSRGER